MLSLWTIFHHGFLRAHWNFKPSFTSLSSTEILFSLFLRTVFTPKLADYGTWGFITISIWAPHQRLLFWYRWTRFAPSYFMYLTYILICGNKMPTRCNRGFYCRSYCLLNMFRASLCPSSGAQEYYTVVAACGISCCGFSSSWSGVELRDMCPVCRMLRILQTGHITLSSTPDQLLEKPQHKIPHAATTV